MAAGEKVKPLPRFLKMIRCDRWDVIAVIIFSIVTSVLALATPLAVEALVNTVAQGRMRQPLIVLGIILATFLLFATVLRILVAVVAEIVQRRFFVRLAVELGERLPRIDPYETRDRYGPELVNRFMDVITVQKVVATMLLDGVALIITTFTGMLLLAFYHPFLLGFDLVLLALMAIIIFVLGRGAVKSAIEESASKYRMVAWLEEITRAPTAFAMHGGRQFASERVDELASDYLEHRSDHFRALMRQIVTAGLLYVFASVSLLMLGGYLVLIDRLTLGQLVAAELVVTVIVGGFAKIGKYMESYYDLMAAMGKIGVLLDLPTAGEGAELLAAQRQAMRVELRTARPAESPPKFQAVSLQLAPAEHLAITGPTASGKTRLLQAIAGRWDVGGGFISVDGFDVRDLSPEATGEAIGYAGPIEVFAGTLRDNISLSRTSVDGSAVQASLHAAGLLDTLRHWSDGLQTELTTDDGRLSDGQKVRLMIARAIAGRPRLLCVDGLFDRLPGTEAGELLDRLVQPENGWTLIFTTGRADLADRVGQQLTLPTAQLHVSGASTDV